MSGKALGEVASGTLAGGCRYLGNVNRYQARLLYLVVLGKVVAM
jgi:hypothetical protein